MRVHNPHLIKPLPFCRLIGKEILEMERLFKIVRLMAYLVEKQFDQNWNYINRDNIIRRLQRKPYDILIIDGGITGAGVAREAAMRGLKVVLVEMQDFASGTEIK
jgi:glycerol-3-phosphate dehydrogenase